MPYGRKKFTRRTKRGRANRYAKKKRWSKRKTFSKATQPGIGRGMSTIVFPQSMFKTLTYDSGPITFQQATTNVPQTYTFVGNNIYDPNYTGIGSQPRWYDTFLGASGGTAPYLKYMVYGSKITLTCYQDPLLGGSTGSVMGLISVTPTYGPGLAPSSVKEMKERAFVRYKPVGNANASRPVVIKHFCKTKAMYAGAGLGENLDFSANYNTDPAKQWYWQINACNIIPYLNAGANGLFSCYIDVKIKYYCKFFNLNDVADS